MKEIIPAVLMVVFFVSRSIAGPEVNSSSQKIVAFFGKQLGNEAVTGDAREVAGNLARQISEEFPDPDQQYKIALMAWALNQPADGDPSEESVYNTSLFWAAISALSSKSKKNSSVMILEIADICRLEGGYLLMALEKAYPDPERFRQEAVR